MVTSPMRGITRIDYGRGRSWWVRLYRGGKLRHRHFSDGIYGSEAKALRAARAWRDQLASKLPPPKRGGRVPVGYGYVKRVEMQRRAERWPVWLAWIRMEGKRAASTSYSIERWGSREAKRRANLYLESKRRELARNAKGRP